MEKVEFNTMVDVNRLIKAIEDDVDWFIARIQEQDLHKRELYHAIWSSKRDKLREIVEEVCEKLK